HDTTMGICRSLSFSTPNGEVTTQICHKDDSRYELYLQDYPSNHVNFQVCVDKGCVGRYGSTNPSADWSYIKGYDSFTKVIDNTTNSSGRLFLGFNDGFVMCNRSGLDIGGVGDNSGSFSANITITHATNTTLEGNVTITLNSSNSTSPFYLYENVGAFPVTCTG